jgi:hypothetical protein
LILDCPDRGRRRRAFDHGQIEYWPKLGRAVELHLRAGEALRLKRAGEARPLSSLLSSVGSAGGRKRLAAHLATRPYPHFEAAPGKRGLLVKIEEDGSRTVGRFVNRKFRPSK